MLARLHKLVDDRHLKILEIADDDYDILLGGELVGNTEQRKSHELVIQRIDSDYERALEALNILKDYLSDRDVITDSLFVDLSEAINGSKLY